MLNHERRFFASIIDIGIVLVISLLISIFVPNTIFTRDLTILTTYFVVAFIYMFLSLLITKDKTIGLYSMSLRLLGRDWEKPNFKIILLRSITHAIPVLYLVNILYMILYKTEETFFDELSDSFIVQTGDTFKVENKTEKE